VLTEYRERKNEILKVNKYVKVLFIECPYYSITKANRLKRGANNRETDKNNNTIVKRNYNGQDKGRTYPQLVINKVKGRRDVKLATQTDKEICTPSSIKLKLFQYLTYVHCFGLLEKIISCDILGVFVLFIIAKCSL
jgi:hypothetical protein